MEILPWMLSGALYFLGIFTAYQTAEGTVRDRIFLSVFWPPAVLVYLILELIGVE